MGKKVSFFNHLGLEIQSTFDQLYTLKNEPYPGTESMGKPWKNHGESMGKIPWIPLKTMEHGAGAKFHGFHGEFPMLSMLAWDSKNCKITPHGKHGIKNHGKPWKAWEAWEFTKMKAWKAWEAWYFPLYYF